MDIEVIEICDADFDQIDFPLPEEAIAEMQAYEQGVTDGKRQIREDIVTSDETLLVYVNGKPTFVTGVDTDLWSEEYKAYVVWGFSSIYADDCHIAMVKEGRKIVKRFGEDYGRIINCVDRRYAKSQKWLKMLGFRMTGNVVFHNGVPFDEMLYCHDWQEEDK